MRSDLLFHCTDAHLQPQALLGQCSNMQNFVLKIYEEEGVYPDFKKRKRKHFTFASKTTVLDNGYFHAVEGG